MRPAGENRTRSAWMEARCAAVTPQRDGVVDRVRSGDLHLGKVTRHRLRYYDMETPDVIETSRDALCRRTAAHVPTGSNCFVSGVLVVQDLGQAFTVGITEPTVALMPIWASGVSATCLATIGSGLALAACIKVPSSMSLPSSIACRLSA
jgi:hypothetical protein